MTEAEFDKSKAEAFAGRMLSIFNNACLGLLMSLGNRTNLFTALAATTPATSKQIADHAELDE